MEQPKCTSRLQVLVCSANIGNAEPTPESFDNWVPDDGDVSSIVNRPMFPLRLTDENDNMAEIDMSLEDSKFDIIALGMQEATFGKSKAGVVEEFEDSEDDEDGEEYEALETIPSTEEDCMQPRVSVKLGAKKEKKKKKALSGIPSVVGRKSSKEFVEEADKDDGDNSSTRATKTDVKKNKTGTQQKVTDIVKLNATEDHTKLDKKFWGKDTNVFFSLINRRCPSYVPKVAMLRGQMRLIILVNKSIADEISDVDVACENTGIGQVMANKGGIVAMLTIRKTKLAFMSCHLQAHEGEKNFQLRCSSLTSILRGAKVGKKTRDVSLSSHHMFVCGDLNYRTVLPTAGKVTHEEHVTETFEHVKLEKWHLLQEFDELKKALREKQCLVNFRTLPCNFPPTFKVERGEGITYNPQRTPSYTDRILWNSSYGLKNDVKPLLYEPCVGFITSDHKPIRGAFSITTLSQPPGETPPPMMDLNTKGVIRLIVSNIKCSELASRDYDGESDPYVLFAVDPKELLTNQNKAKGFMAKFKHKDHKNSIYPRTNHFKNERNPEWKDVSVPLIFEGGDEDFVGAKLYITAMDYDYGSADDTIGTVSVSLEHLWKDISENHNFFLKTPPHMDVDNMNQKHIDLKEPLIRNGALQGTIECRISVCYLDKTGEHKYDEEVNVNGSEGKKRRKSLRKFLRKPVKGAIKRLTTSMRQLQT